MGSKLISKNNTVRVFLLCIASLLVPNALSSAQEGGIKVLRLGVMNSIKEQSIVVLTNSSKKENTFNTYSLSADCYGIFNHKARQPGVKFMFSHNTILHRVTLNESIDYLIYIGAGGVCGYVRDYSNMKFNPGALLGLTTSAGCIMAFAGTNFEMGLDFTAQWAIHLRQMEEQNARLGLSWYANGLIYALIPQVCIIYRF